MEAQGSQIQNSGTDLNEAIALLSELIEIPSFSKEENRTADILEKFFMARAVPVKRHLNNVWVVNKYFDARKPTILLNSHHDTVRPNKAYTLDPFTPLIKDNKLYGLGSNDAGGCLVSLIFAFLHFYESMNLNYNLILAASAEEEISGPNGIQALLPHLGKIEFGIVGEPTLMQMAVAEKGLIVLDCTGRGKAGHAARNEGINALYSALPDIEWFKSFSFQKVSPMLGPVKMTVTHIETENKAHNCVPASCHFTVDVRYNELYTPEEIIQEIKEHVSCEVKVRGLKIRSTSIPFNHPIVKAGMELGRVTYGSPTSSDKALMDFPVLKMGPGDSARSHTADEFIYLNEIKEGIDLYTHLLKKVIDK
jgi:acetylornithine deacetylase